MLLIVIRYVVILEKLSMRLHVIHMTDYHFAIANSESCIFGSRVLATMLAEWVSVLKSWI